MERKKVTSVIGGRIPSTLRKTAVAEKGTSSKKKLPTVGKKSLSTTRNVGIVKQKTLKESTNLAPTKKKTLATVPVVEKEAPPEKSVGPSAKQKLPLSARKITSPKNENLRPALSVRNKNSPSMRTKTPAESNALSPKKTEEVTKAKTLSFVEPTPTLSVQKKITTSPPKDNLVKVKKNVSTAEGKAKPVISLPLRLSDKEIRQLWKSHNSKLVPSKHRIRVTLMGRKLNL